MAIHFPKGEGIKIIKQLSEASVPDSIYILPIDENIADIVIVSKTGKKRKVGGVSIEILKENFPLLDLSNLNEENEIIWKQRLGGLDGQNATVNVGSVTSLNPGDMPTIKNVGTPSNVILDFGIPKGDTGAFVFEYNNDFTI
ncbi:hypothetical protein ACMGDK_11360 [Chryseobacterium sp. DT-3]|uniref:hypothetical protein n=1 Tax=Chryseobacterium sp. DT-3 TaxID=3396164 RepID=UPI003F1DAB62